jgi:membrane associated rhomboid family serine protease
VALLVILAIVFVVYSATTPTERAAFVKRLRAAAQRRAVAAADWYEVHEPFFTGLRARTRLAPLTPAFVLVNVGMFVIVFVSSVVQGHNALIEWGASIGPRTTNGEWWRLVTSLFVHAGPLHLLACLVGFFPLAFVMERLFGSVALAVVYVASGVFAGLSAISAYPLDVSVGAAGAICGLYGLAAATWMWRLLQRPRVTVPWGVLKWIGCTGLIFLGYNLVAGTVPPESLFAGFLVGALSGAAIGRGVGERTIPLRRCAAVGAAALGVAIFTGVPVHGICDVRPDIDHMMVTDERTAAAFRAAVTQLSQGRLGEKAMITLIDGEILPALEREQQRLASEGLVPEDQEAVLAAAREYVQLRIEYWGLRTQAIRKGSIAMLRQADKKEGAARDVLVRIPYPLAPA